MLVLHQDCTGTAPGLYREAELQVTHGEVQLASAHDVIQEGALHHDLKAETETARLRLAELPVDELTLHD